MNAARMLIAGTLGMVLFVAQAHAQDAPSNFADAPPTPTELSQPQEAPPQAPPQLPQHVLSNWLTYRDKSYRGEMDGSVVSPVIGTELFVRSGPSAPIGGGVFPQALSVGWIIEAGGRVLFYNPDMNGAWVVEASFSNNYNHAETNNHDILVNGTEATVHSLNRTFLNLGLGHDWCLATPMEGRAKWNFGVDAGVRYGTGEVAFHEIANQTSLLTGAYAAVHTDLQIPYGCFVFEMGFRAEWAYTHSYEFLPTPNDMQDINILANFGVRY